MDFTVHVSTQQHTFYPTTSFKMFTIEPFLCGARYGRVDVEFSMFVHDYHYMCSKWDEDTVGS